MNYTDRQKELTIDLINKQLNKLEESIKCIEGNIKHNLAQTPNKNKLVEAELFHGIGEHYIKLAQCLADKFNLETVLKTIT
jgi:hypothetical protein